MHQVGNQFIVIRNNNEELAPSRWTGTNRTSALLRVEPRLCLAIYRHVTVLCRTEVRYYASYDVFSQTIGSRKPLTGRESSATSIHLSTASFITRICASLQFFFCRFNISYHIFDGTGFHSVIYHCWRHSKRCENDKREKGRRGATRTLKSLGRFGTFNYNAVTFLNFFTKCCEMCGLERPRLSICPSHSQFTYNNSKSTYAKFIYFIVIRAGRQ